jgi:hypothetical protein
VWLGSFRGPASNPCRRAYQTASGAGLSGYLHDEEAERFGRLVRPILAETNRGRIAA